MPLQGSGAISISQIRNELVSCGSTYSLRTLSSRAGKGTPDSMSEFFGYSNTVTIDLMVQAAGGGGGGGWPGGGGGGGAGGQAQLTGYSISRCSSFSVGVGGGGAFAGQRWVDDDFKGANGGNSNFGSISLNGGGGGGSSGGSYITTDFGYGENGGCGGGGGINGNQGNNGRQGIPGYPGGFGRNGGPAPCNAGGGGGGGTSLEGQASCSDNNGGWGGNGRYVNDFGEYYGGGGGGGNWNWNWAATGGVGGGGKGASSDGGNYDNVWQSSDPGVPNTGGGGGGIAHVGAPGRNGSGGSGIVRIRYAGGQVCSGGNSVFSSGGYTYHTFTSSGTFST
jgi:hypothetical protein